VWTTVSVRREVKDALEELMRELGLSSPNDAVAYLLRRYRECGKLEELLASVLERVGRVEERLATLEGRLGAPPATQPSTPRARPSSGRSKAWEILERDGVSCRSDMRKVKDPDAVVDRLLAEGAYAVSLEGDRCAVLPEAVEELLERLRGVKSSEPRVVEAQLEDRKLVKVFRALYGAGVLYYNQEEGWALLEEALEKR